MVGRSLPLACGGFLNVDQLSWGERLGFFGDSSRFDLTCIESWADLIADTSPLVGVFSLPPWWYLAKTYDRQVRRHLIGGVTA